MDVPAPIRPRNVSAYARPAFLTRGLAIFDEAAGLVLDDEEQLEAAGFQLAMYQRDAGRTAILAVVESINEVE